MTATPAGDYWATPIKIYQDKSRGEKKTMCLVIEAETQEQIVQTGEKEPEYIPCTPESIKIYMYLSEKAQDMTFARLKMLNAQDSFNDNSMTLHPENGGFIVTCEHSEFEGKQQIRWNFPFDNTPTEWDDQESLQMEAAWKQFDEQNATDAIPM